jgi:hypothetical protein
LYLPASHTVHGPPLGPDQPALQMKSAKAVLCAGELEPAGQLSQAPDPAALLYLPATHWEHGPPCGPDQPELQVHSAKHPTVSSPVSLHNSSPVCGMILPSHRHSYIGFIFRFRFIDS